MSPVLMAHREPQTFTGGWRRRPARLALRGGALPRSRPPRLGRLKNELPRRRRIQRGVGKHLECDSVQVRLPLPLQGEANPQMLGAHHVLQHRIVIRAEAEYNEGLSEDRVLGIERKNLQGYILPVGFLNETAQLFAHHGLITNAALQDRFVQNNRQLDSFAVEYLLTMHPDSESLPIMPGGVGSTRL